MAYSHTKSVKDLHKTSNAINTIAGNSTNDTYKTNTHHNFIRIHTITLKITETDLQP